MLIEDNEMGCYITKLLLEKSSLATKVIIKSTVDAAIEHIIINSDNPENLPHLILVDLLSPSLNGSDFLIMHSQFPDELRCRTKIINYSYSFYRKENNRIAENQSIFYTLEKPISLESINKLIAYINQFESCRIEK